MNKLLASVNNQVVLRIVNYLGEEVEGEVIDIVALISLIIGALLDRFKLTIGQSTSMIVVDFFTFICHFSVSTNDNIHDNEAHWNPDLASNYN